MTINDLPARRGQVNYVVPRLTVITKPDGQRFAMNGDHIHGIRDRAGVSLAVFGPENCPVCERL